MIFITYIMRPIMVSVGGTVRYSWTEIQCSVQLHLSLSLDCYPTFQQGRIEPPKAARGHATSYSACIDGIVLSVTKNNVSG